MGSFSLPTVVNACCKKKQQKPRVTSTSPAVWLTVQIKGERDSCIQRLCDTALSVPRGQLSSPGAGVDAEALGKWTISRWDGRQTRRYLPSPAPFSATRHLMLGRSLEEFVPPAQAAGSRTVGPCSGTSPARSASPAALGTERERAWLLLTPHRFPAAAGASLLDMGCEHTRAYRWVYPAQQLPRENRVANASSPAFPPLRLFSSIPGS